MASNYTEHYNLCQWEPTDQFVRTDFNEDNAKIDAALHGLSEAATEHSNLLQRCGNCQIYTTTYIGNGQYGYDKACTFTCPHPPVLVHIQGQQDNSAVLIVRPNEVCNIVGRSNTSGPSFRWNGNTVLWFSDSAAWQMNVQQIEYRVFMLLAADE